MTPTERELQAALVVARDAITGYFEDKRYGLALTGMAGTHLKNMEQALSAINAVIPDQTAPNLREQKHDDT